MRIGCPGCRATYEVPDAQLHPGRAVQCTRCKVTWQPAGAALPRAAIPEAPMAELPPRPAPVLRHHRVAPNPPASQASGDGRSSGRSPGRSSGRSWGVSLPAMRHAVQGAIWGIAWGASLGLLLAGGVAFAHFRGLVIHGWPATIRLYDLLGPS